MGRSEQQIKVVFFFCLSMLLVLQPFHGSATTIDDLQNRIKERNDEIKKLENEIAGYQKALTETSSQSKTLNGEIQRINTQIKKLNADIALTQQKIRATQLEITQLSGQISDKETVIKQQKQAIASILRELYETGETPPAEMLLMHPQISDFFVQIANAETINNSMRDQVQNLEATKNALEDARNSQQQKKTSLQGLQANLQDTRQVNEGTKQQRQQLLTLTKSKETAYQLLLKNREEKRKAMLDEIQRTEDELRKLIDANSLPAAHSGVLSWPIKGAILLTQSFGNTPDSKILYNGKPHNGIDMKASVGTQIYAAGTGVVRATGDTDVFPGCLSYGRWVLIDHPNNLATLYAHLSLIKVNKGDTVTADSIIGLSGTTGYATGPHLHFTVYDARTVEFKSSSTPGSGCKLLPFGGYLNPLAYL